MKTQNDNKTTTGKTDLTRRRFIAGAGALSVIAASGGLVAGVNTAAYAGSIAPINGERQWDMETEIVVLGAGCTGGVAAIEVASAGGQVILIEKASKEEAGGDSTCNGGYIIPSCYNAENMVRYSFGKMDLAWAKSIEEEALKAPDWLLEKADVSYDMDMDTMKHFPGSGPTIYQGIKNGLAEFDFEILYNSPAKSLITNENGEVIGVEIEQNGKALSVKASKAVIIATGSYTANKDLVRELHLPGVDYHTTGAPANTGDGLIMGLAIGASPMMLGMGVDWDSVAFKKASDEMEMGVAVSARATGIIVNSAGQRFMNEGMSITHNKGELPFMSFDGAFPGYNGYKNLPMWEIWDEAVVSTTPLGNHYPESGLLSGWTWATAHKIVDWSTDNTAEVQKGWVFKADSLEELAQLMTTRGYMGESISVDAAALMETIETYNRHCDAGADPDFNKAEAMLKPVTTPPFYAAELSPSIMYTIGGLKVNANGQTLDYNDTPIPRLYSAGNVGQGVQLSPYSIPACMACGRLAARHAMTLKPWDL